jgi:5'-nucleotidase
MAAPPTFPHETERRLVESGEDARLEGGLRNLARPSRAMLKTLYIDLDNVLVDFRSAFPHVEASLLECAENLDDIPGIFSQMRPMPKAVESFEELAKLFDTYILSTAPWGNPSAWSDKLLWVKTHLGEAAYKRLTLTHHKNLNRGDYLVDDRAKNGANRFSGNLILFGSPQFPDWLAVTAYLRSSA